MIDDRVPCDYLGAGYPRANAIVRALLPHCERFAFYPLIFPDQGTDDAHAAFDARIEVLYSRGRSKLAATLAQYAQSFDVLWVSRPDNMRLVDAALRTRPDLRRRLTLVYDAEALYAARTAGVYASHGQPLDAAATDALYDDELALAAQADVLISVSAAEAQLFAQRTGKPTFVVGFTTLPAPGTAGFAERSGLGFIGGIRPDSPNEDSLLWYAANVMHAVHARTGALLHVAGFIDSQPVLAFAGPQCAIHGPIAAPALLFDRVRVFIAPTRFAAGLPQKLIDAAAAGVPIVATSLLARALGWESERELLVADDAPAFAAACVRLLSDRDVWERLRGCALAAVGRGFGAEVFSAQLDAAVEAIAAQLRGRATASRGEQSRRAAPAPLGLTFVNGYRIYPALNGGHRRILDAYTGFGSAAEVDFISLGADPLDGGYHRIDDRHGEIRVPKALEHVRSEAQANGRTGTGVGQIYLADFALHTPAFGATLQRSLDRAEIAIVGSPYVYPVVRARFNGPIVYHAHDVEALLQADLLAGTPCAPELIDHIETLERDCARDAALIVAMSQDDVIRFAERYGIAPELGFALPPSVDLSQARRRVARRRQAERAVAVFVGSHWQPNVVGVRALIELAPALPEIDFVVVGGVADAFAAVVPPRNLRFTGFIPESERTALLLTADVALNPCQAESGVNMKMTDYVLASLPIVSTPSGARGLGFSDGVHARLVPLSSFGSALRALCREPEEGTRLAENALERLRIEFDLQRNRAALFERLSGLLAAQPGVPSKAMV